MDTMNFFAEQTLNHRLWKTYVLKGDRLAGGGLAGGWEGNAKKLGCDDHCTTINVIKFIVKNTIKETSIIVLDQISVSCSLAN